MFQYGLKWSCRANAVWLTTVRLLGVSLRLSLFILSASKSFLKTILKAHEMKRNVVPYQQALVTFWYLNFTSASDALLKVRCICSSYYTSVASGLISQYNGKHGCGVLCVCYPRTVSSACHLFIYPTFDNRTGFDFCSVPDRHLCRSSCRSTQ